MKYNLLLILFLCGSSYLLYSTQDMSLLYKELLNAIECEDDKKVEFLLKENPVADLNYCPFSGKTLLHRAAEIPLYHHVYKAGGITQSTINIINALLVNKACPNIQNLTGNTPLSYFLRIHIKEDYINLFLEHNADLNIKNATGRSPFYFYIKNNPEIHTLQLLLEKKANPCIAIDNKYPYEIVRTQEARNALLKAIPTGFLQSSKSIYMTFLLCMKVLKKDKDTKKFIPPRPIIQQILGVSFIVDSLRYIENIENEKFLSDKEKKELKRIMNQLIKDQSNKKERHT